MEQPDTDNLLQAKNLSKSFGGIKAVNNARIEVNRGSISGLIGPNGAGKTTLFNLLSNFIKPDSGSIHFDRQPIHNLPPHKIADLGFIRTFQVARVLSRLSVLENMLLASPNQTGENFFKVWFQQGKMRQEERANKEKAMSILMTNPKLILIDEPAAGVNPALIDRICEYIVDWNKQGISFLVIEHNMDVIMSLCDRVWVLAEGTNLAEGRPDEMQHNNDVLETYLGH